MNLVYFSSVSENTHRFVKKLEIPALRIPLRAAPETSALVTEPFILITPTYGGGSRKGADVPKQVIRFLNQESNRNLLRGVIASGNTNFGADFCRAGDVVAQKCAVPVLHRFELLGTTEDVHTVQSIMEKI
jgi:protein involved in ribonucleotide reduction